MNSGHAVDLGQEDVYQYVEGEGRLGYHAVGRDKAVMKLWRDKASAFLAIDPCRPYGLTTAEPVQGYLEWRRSTFVGPCMLPVLNLRSTEEKLN
jgi:hypothetical protein